MITRAIVIDKDLSIGKLKVQIPILQGIGDGGLDIKWATIIYIPGIDIDYQIGDIVEVGFEDNDRGRPVVLGFLKLRDKKVESRAYGTFKELNIEEKLSAPLETTIGKTSYQELFDTVEAALKSIDLRNSESGG